MNTFIYVFHPKFLYMSPALGVANSTLNEHKGLWKIFQNKGPFPCSPQKDLFPPLKSFHFFLFHLVHLMNMCNHISKHVFIVKFF
jgi:hypothetical protein